jgi:hypothetical protein
MAAAMVAIAAAKSNLQNRSQPAELLDPEVVDASAVCNHFDHPARGFATA